MSKAYRAVRADELTKAFAPARKARIAARERGAVAAAGVNWERAAPL